jgi:hypothetical protein
MSKFCVAMSKIKIKREQDQLIRELLEKFRIKKSKKLLTEIRKVSPNFNYLGFEQREMAYGQEKKCNTKSL